MSITASMVKELRERTGAGMMECKKALVEMEGDLESAVDHLRKKGQAKAAKRAGKVAAEGIVIVKAAADNKSAFMLEANSETDFVARDTNFTGFVNAVAQAGIDAGVNDVEQLSQLTMDGNTIEHARESLVSKIGENVQLRRAARIESTGTVGTYLHGDRIGVMVALDIDDAELARDIAMHVAATNPQAIDESGLAPEIVEREREVLIGQAKESGKPDDIIEKMIAGRMSKFIKEVCLTGQAFIKNPDMTVEKLLQGSSAKVLSFTRYEVGEGIEKETVDFAEEVRAQVQGE